MYAYVGGNPVSSVDSMGLASDGAAANTSSSGNCGGSGGSGSGGPGYLDRYMDFTGKYAVNVGPYAAALLGGLWPKSWAPASDFRPPALGSKNWLTSVPRGVFGMPGADTALVRAGAAGIGLATVGIGIYNATIFVEGLAYALPDGSGGGCTCKK